jgi:tetratricopeptide (TPR) repeat protein
MEKNPNSPSLHFNRGATLERLGRKDDAVKAYKLVMRLKPDHTKAQQRLQSLGGTAAPLLPPMVIAVDDDEEVEVPQVRRKAKGRDRWIHPIWLVLLLLYVVGLSGIAWYTMAPYRAGGYIAGAFFCALMFLAGLQAIRRGHRGDRRYPVPVGFVLLALGALGLINGFGYTAYYLATVDWQSMKQARQAQANLDRLREQVRSPRKLSPEEAATAKAENEKRQKATHAKEVRLVIEQIKRADPKEMLGNTMHLASLHPEEGDPRAEVAAVLEGLLTQTDSSVRFWAVHSLASWGSRDTIAKLKPLLRDRDLLVRKEAKKTIDTLEKQP